MKAAIHALDSHLAQIVLAPPIRGFDDFIAAWLVTAPQATILIDPGPAVTSDQLVQALEAQQVRRLDYICLTHIHMDHAGGVGHLAARFPEAVVVCHPKGISHLIDPERLWQGTVKTLGETGRAYGRMLPVPAQRIADENRQAAAPFTLIDTPGHSPHHWAIDTRFGLFVGEAAGVCLPLPDTGRYLRPATPPRFFLETSLASIDRLMAAKPQRICFGHGGMEEDAMSLLETHRNQLLHWQETLKQAVADSGAKAAGREAAWVDLMLEADPLLEGFHRLPQAVQAREKGFLLNSVKGFVGYIKEC